MDQFWWVALVSSKKNPKTFLSAKTKKKNKQKTPLPAPHLKQNKTK